MVGFTQKKGGTALSMWVGVHWGSKYNKTKSAKLWKKGLHTVQSSHRTPPPTRSSERFNFVEVSPKQMKQLKSPVQVRSVRRFGAWHEGLRPHIYDPLSHADETSGPTYCQIEV